MKIATYRVRDAQTPGSAVGAVTGDTIVDLNHALARYLRDREGEALAYELASARIPRDMTGFLQGGDKAVKAAAKALDFVAAEPGMRGISGERLSYSLDEVRLLAPVPRPGKILAAGKNYAEHARESPTNRGGELQPFPRGFVKVASVVTDPEAPVELAAETSQLDYEVELAVVIGKSGRYISRDRAYDHIAGYTILNDVSARDIQLAEARHGNHLVGKNMDSFAPMGPWIVLKDEVPDPMDLNIELKVNGETRQKSSTSNMIHDIPAMIERWSWMTLEPGDIIATGTPAGVALGGKFPYLKVGDTMECIIERIGTLRNPVVKASR
jgi:acylpyruvate hydrolase